MIRLGLCCLFIKAPIKFRTTTASYLMRCPGPDNHLSEIICDNVAALRAAILYCAEHGIGAFRITSQLFPAYTHPEVGYGLEDLTAEETIKQGMRECGQIAKEKRIRLSFHPDPFVVLNSPDEAVLEKSLADLEYHALMAEMVGADVINLHAGGVYGDKIAALQRFREHLSQLSWEVRSRLTVENDDKSYTPQDLLGLGLPVCYDVHHHRCHPDSLSV